MSGSSPSGIARFDSAVAMAQAIGAFPHGGDVASLSSSPLPGRPMPIVNRLPRRAREWVILSSGMTEAVSRRTLHKLDFDRVSEWITARFPNRPYPGVFIGSSNVALVHLARLAQVTSLAMTLEAVERQRVPTFR